MDTLNIIKDLCKRNGTSIKQLEKELDYGNGSLAKAKTIPSDRILDISRYFNVSMEYLMTGKEDNISISNAMLDVEISEDTELKEAIKKYYSLDDRKKKHVIELINLLSEG